MGKEGCDPVGAQADGVPYGAPLIWVSEECTGEVYAERAPILE